MPPGLYEAVITEVMPDMTNPDLIQGKYLFRLEARSLSDIRAFGNNDEGDERRFATVARVSDINLALYRTFAQPVVRSLVTDQAADLARTMHPNRQRFASFSDRNPLMQPVKELAEKARTSRKPVSPDNPLHAMEQVGSTWMSTWLDCYRIWRDGLSEALFVNVYGSPLLRAGVGLAAQADGHRRAERDLAREAMAARTEAEIERLFDAGGLPEALMRALLYIRGAHGSADERGFSMLKLLREARPSNERLHLADIKKMIAIQFLLIRLDTERALKTLPTLLPERAEDRRFGFDLLTRVLGARGALSEEETGRLHRLEALWRVTPPAAPPKETANA
jgi:hypothetical protein